MAALAPVRIAREGDKKCVDTRSSKTQGNLVAPAVRNEKKLRCCRSSRTCSPHDKLTNAKRVKVLSTRGLSKLSATMAMVAMLILAMGAAAMKQNAAMPMEDDHAGTAEPVLELRDSDVTYDRFPIKKNGKFRDVGFFSGLKRAKRTGIYTGAKGFIQTLFSMRGLFMLLTIALFICTFFTGIDGGKYDFDLSSKVSSVMTLAVGGIMLTSMVYCMRYGYQQTKLGKELKADYLEGMGEADLKEKMLKEKKRISINYTNKVITMLMPLIILIVCVALMFTAQVQCEVDGKEAFKNMFNSATGKHEMALMILAGLGMCTFGGAFLSTRPLYDAVNSVKGTDEDSMNSFFSQSKTTWVCAFVVIAIIYAIFGYYGDGEGFQFIWDDAGASVVARIGLLVVGIPIIIGSLCVGIDRKLMFNKYKEQNAEKSTVEGWHLYREARQKTKYMTTASAMMVIGLVILVLGSILMVVVSGIEGLMDDKDKLPLILAVGAMLALTSMSTLVAGGVGYFCYNKADNVNLDGSPALPTLPTAEEEEAQRVHNEEEARQEHEALHPEHGNDARRRLAQLFNC